ncbi:MAG: efflux RND transporter periplasmic adaptor subunit [Saprospiraceae bacterium]
MLKKWNIFYWIIVPVLLLSMVYFSNKLKVSHQEYFGFAETKESEINLDNEVMVSKIFVETGQMVKEGDVLLQVINREVDQEIKQMDITLQGLDIQNSIDDAEIKTEIITLNQKKEIAISEIETKLATAASEFNFYLQLAGKQSKEKDKNHPTVVLIESLEKEKKKLLDEYAIALRHFQQRLNLPKESVLKRNILKNQQAFLQKYKTALDVVAPYDGIVGSVNVREGEHIKSYSSLVSFLEPRPGIIRGYVQEKYTVNLNIGDSVEVMSKYHPDKQTYGVIGSIGNRIIEIPEKFRRIPDVKIYGIEVLIYISRENNFLQKEICRVMPKEKI